MQEGLIIKGTSSKEMVEDNAKGPDVNFLAELLVICVAIICSKVLRREVLLSPYSLGREGSIGRGAKVTQFEYTILGEEEVAWVEVFVNDFEWRSVVKVI